MTISTETSVENIVDLTCRFNKLLVGPDAVQLEEFLLELGLEVCGIVCMVVSMHPASSAVISDISELGKVIQQKRFSHSASFVLETLSAPVFVSEGPQLFSVNKNGIEALKAVAWSLKELDKTIEGSTIAASSKMILTEWLRIWNETLAVLDLIAQGDGRSVYKFQLDQPAQLIKFRDLFDARGLDHVISALDTLP